MRHHRTARNRAVPSDAGPVDRVHEWAVTAVRQARGQQRAKPFPYLRGIEGHRPRFGPEFAQYRALSRAGQACEDDE
ncbi:hypothetical protein GCM10027563_02780 [Parasphingorhabdus pacifica]